MKDVLLGMATCTSSQWIRRAVSPSLVNLIEVTCQQLRGVFLEGGVARREGWFSNSFSARKEGARGMLFLVLARGCARLYKSRCFSPRTSVAGR